MSILFSEKAGISAPEVVEALANEPVTLNCYVKSLLPFGVRWMKNGVKIGKIQHYLYVFYFVIILFYLPIIVTKN